MISLPRYGLIGEKLSHSFSAPIHEKLGGYPYELIPLAREELDGFLRGREFAAINVTIPYKQEVIPYLDEIDSAARDIGAVNTIVNRDGRLCGYNTDFYGFEQTLLRSGIDPAGKNVLILGSGGTCRTVQAVLRYMGAARITVVSRSGREGAVTYDEAVQMQDTDIVVNASPAGMYPNTETQAIDLSVFPRLCGVADVVYNPLRTRLLLQAEALGVPCTGGLYMLVAQAKRAAELFLNRELPGERIEEIHRELQLEKANLVLTGMPVSGKSTIGRLAAESLGKHFVDIDAVIEERSGMTIPEIFERFNEAGFREREREAIQALSAENGLVLSTGGGAILDPVNVRNLRHNGIIVFLDRPLELLTVGANRPLAKSREEIEALYRRRYPLYCERCDARIVNDSDMQSALERVLEAFRERLNLIGTA